MRHGMTTPSPIRCLPGDGSAWLGGSWDDFPDDLRMALRVSAAAGERDGYYGLRVARTLDP